VRGENRSGPAQLERLREAQPGSHVLTDPLEPEEARMTLVGVEHLGFRVPGDRAERAHRADPAHPEQQLLAKPVLTAPAV